jgi:type IV secretion system protein VirB5
MNIKYLFLKKPAPGADPRRSNEKLVGGRRKGENENPYLSARRTWNDHVGGVVASRQNWQIIGILGMLIALAAVGGLVAVASQAKFVPYVVEVDKLGATVAVAPAQKAAVADVRVIEASLAAFINDARLVTPDIALQRKAIFRLYAMLAANDPATARMNDWLNGTEDSSPFKRAAKETVSIEISSVLQQTPETWQVDWVETVRDRQGIMNGKPFRMRALLTLYTVEPTAGTTEEQIRNNPLGLYIRDFSWSKQL